LTIPLEVGEQQGLCELRNRKSMPGSGTFLHFFSQVANRVAKSFVQISSFCRVFEICFSE